KVFFWFFSFSKEKNRTLRLPGIDSLAHGLDDGQVGLVEQVHIDLGGGGGGAVAQSAADAEEGNVPAVGDGGEGVAQAVEGHIGQVGAGQDSLEAVAEVVGLVGQPSVVAQDES